MNYRVLLSFEQGRNYYKSYLRENSLEECDIECEELPPYADVLKAQSCYWDADNQEWIFDADVYAEKLQNELEEQITPSHEELAQIVLELAGMISEVTDALARMQTQVNMINAMKSLAEQINDYTKED